MIAAKQVFARTAGAALVQENRIRILKNGQEKYPAWLDAIGAARKTLHFESYIIHTDDVGYRFADLLCTKAHKVQPAERRHRKLFGAGSSRGSAGRTATGVLAIGSAVGAAFRSQQTLAPGRNFRADRCRCGTSLPCRNRGSLAARDRPPSGCSGHLDGVQGGPRGTSLVLGVTNKDLTSEKSRVGVRSACSRTDRSLAGKFYRQGTVVHLTEQEGGLPRVKWIDDERTRKCGWW